LSRKEKVDDKIIEAVHKLDERTKERLAKKITEIAEEDWMSPTQRNCIRVLKVICAIGVIFSTPIVPYIYTQLQIGVPNLIFWIALVPFVFLITVAVIVDLIIKTPE